MPERHKTVKDALRAIEQKFEELARRPLHYRLLPDGRIEPCGMWEWAETMERKQHVLRQTYIGDFLISTIFLGMDHSFGFGPPLLFETMVFDHRNLRPEQETIKERRVETVHQDRCSLLSETYKMHWLGECAAISEQAKWMLPYA